MKKQLILALAFFTLLISACEEMTGEPIFTPESNMSQTLKPISISSFNPVSAISGSEIAIYGENFGASITDNYVTFNYPGANETETGWASEVVQVPHTGMVLIRLPQNLNPGEYTISLHFDGQTTRSNKPFKIINASGPGN
ncbi:IPT/TIG domain-containing protein [Aquiflexum sp.]|uniref:IPT/TIG domain-containing protein n=1 Tax=Aquiflexum sp. TaxID=1872584 RepID=UPI00359447C6